MTATRFLTFCLGVESYCQRFSMYIFVLESSHSHTSEVGGCWPNNVGLFCTSLQQWQGTRSSWFITSTLMSLRTTVADFVACVLCRVYSVRLQTTALVRRRRWNTIDSTAPPRLIPIKAQASPILVMLAQEKDLRVSIRQFVKSTKSLLLTRAQLRQSVIEPTNSAGSICHSLF